MFQSQLGAVLRPESLWTGPSFVPTRQRDISAAGLERLDATELVQSSHTRERRTTQRTSICGGSNRFGAVCDKVASAKANAFKGAT